MPPLLRTILTARLGICVGWTLGRRDVVDTILVPVWMIAVWAATVTWWVS